MTTAEDELRSWYDAAPYASYAYPQCAPEQLAAVAALFGLAAPDLAGARVLELGCSSGGNLIPFALRQPGARVLGIDIADSHVAAGQRAISRLGLANAELRVGNLAELDPAALGEFDYVVCHGLYSWIPREVQDAMLALCGRVLAADGIAYVSYNTYPGWKSREMIRDAMLLHARGKTDAGERLGHARAMLGFLRQVAPRDGLMARVLEENIRILNGTGSDYLAHDYLEPFNLPAYFQDFVAHAGRHGLAYLAEAEPSRMDPANQGATIGQTLRASFGHDPVLMEQYLDFAVNRTFRQTLLVPQARAAAIRRERPRGALGGVHVAARLRPTDGPSRADGSAQTYANAAGASLSTPHLPVKLALDALAAAWPGTLSRERLIAGMGAAMPADAPVGAAVDELLDALVGRGLARMRLAPLEFAAPGAEFPAVDAGIRRAITALAGDDRFVANLWHESVELTPAARRHLPLFDGSRSRGELQALLAAGAEPVALDALLAFARDNALLATVAEPAA
jgi:SAM-dependent methyltransferase